MHSLHHILSSHGSALVLDASSQVIHGGWLERDKSPRWSRSTQEAGVGVFQVLAQLGVSPSQAQAFIFCEGPGSILGIRTVATVLRTWIALNPRPVYCYRSLELVAHTTGQVGQTIICDARRQSWHTLTIGPDFAFAGIHRTPTAELPAQNLLSPDGFRCWSAWPSSPPTIVAYNPPQLSDALTQAPLLRPTEDPDAFLHEDPSYVQWTPRIHRAPPSSQ
ncbi:MAG: peptidase M22 [Candidatus Synoicihabitans palmerolidicus]|nr:peptidase M22 [Candidatus Synoicihabitans palmerolidicus]